MTNTGGVYGVVNRPRNMEIIFTISKEHTCVTTIDAVPSLCIERQLTDIYTNSF